MPIKYINNKKTNYNQGKATTTRVPVHKSVVKQPAEIAKISDSVKVVEKIEKPEVKKPEIDVTPKQENKEPIENNNPETDLNSETNEETNSETTNEPNEETKQQTELKNAGINSIKILTKLKEFDIYTIEDFLSNKETLFDKFPAGYIKKETFDKYVTMVEDYSNK